MNPVRIVCLGPGVTAIETAVYSKRLFPQATVVLITPDADHTLAYDHASVLMATERLPGITVDLEKACKHHHIELIIGTVTGIDRQTKSVFVGNAKVPYDYLVLDLHSEPKTGTLQGANKLHDPEDGQGFSALKQHIVTELIKAKVGNQKKHKTFVVLGDTVKGFELACALKELTNHLCEQHLIFRDEITVALASQMTTDVPTVVAHKALRILDDAGVEHYDDIAQAITEEGIAFASKAIDTETIIWAGARKPAGVFANLGLSLGPDGWPLLNNYLQTSDEHVFAPSRHRYPQSTRIWNVPAFKAAMNIKRHAIGKRLLKHRKSVHPPLLITLGEHEAMLATTWCLGHGSIWMRLKRWSNHKRANLIRGSY